MHGRACPWGSRGPPMGPNNWVLSARDPSLAPNPALAVQKEAQAQGSNTNLRTGLGLGPHSTIRVPFASLRSYQSFRNDVSFCYARPSGMWHTRKWRGGVHREARAVITAPSIKSPWASPDNAQNQGATSTSTCNCSHPNLAGHMLSGNAKTLSCASVETSTQALTEPRSLT